MTTSYSHPSGNSYSHASEKLAQAITAQARTLQEWATTSTDGFHAMAQELSRLAESVHRLGLGFATERMAQSAAYEELRVKLDAVREALDG